MVTHGSEAMRAETNKFRLLLGFIEKKITLTSAPMENPIHAESTPVAYIMTFNTADSYPSKTVARLTSKPEPPCDLHCVCASP